MLLFYSEDLTITGYQTFPDTSPLPHILVDDSMLGILEPALGKIKLEPNLALPNNLPEVVAAITAVPVEVQVAEIRKQVSDTIESLLNAKAVELGYQNFLRAGLYLTSPVQKYKDEAQSLTAWAARMYEYVETLEASLTVEQLLAFDLSTLELPAYEPVIAS